MHNLNEELQNVKRQIVDNAKEKSSPDQIAKKAELKAYLKQIESAIEADEQAAILLEQENALQYQKYAEGLKQKNAEEEKRSGDNKDNEGGEEEEEYEGGAEDPIDVDNWNTSLDLDYDKDLAHSDLAIKKENAKEVIVSQAEKKDKTDIKAVAKIHDYILELEGPNVNSRWDATPCKEPSALFSFHFPQVELHLGQ